MVTAICERAVAFSENAMIRVISAQSITLETKGSDSSLKINFMVNNNNYPMMFYFLRFFKKGSTHRIIGKLPLQGSNTKHLQFNQVSLTGALNVSAFIFDDSTRPHASIRVGVESVSPIRELNFDGTIIGGTIPLGVIPIDGVVAPPGREYKKMRFILFKYTWENWDNKNLVSSNNAIKEAFSEYLEDLYEDLSEQPSFYYRYESFSKFTFLIKNS